MEESRFLFERNPSLIAEWNHDKNHDVEMKSITYGSKKKYWWNCLKCTSIYESSPESKSKGYKCPYCAGKQVNLTNSILGLRPDLTELWHPSKNGDLNPSNVILNSNKKYWWYCPVCKSDYDMPAIHKSRGVGCPYCSGRRILKEMSLGSIRPDLEKEWNYEKNTKTPYDVSLNSHKKYHWVCMEKHEWEMSPKSRNQDNSGCPYCASRRILKGFNDMWTTNPILASMLANPEDGHDFMQWSKEYVDWKCLDCNTIIKNKRISEVNNDGIGCPKCGSGASTCERIMFNVLIQLGVQIIPQKSFDWSKKRRYDFYIPSLDIIVETHGNQHYNENGFNTVGGRSLKEEQENDILKERLANENGILNYIVIDCRRSRFEFVKKNILKSKLSSLFDMDLVDWDTVKIESLKSLKMKALKLWLAGENDLHVIAKILGVHENTVKNYIA